MDPVIQHSHRKSTINRGFNGKKSSTRGPFFLDGTYPPVIKHGWLENGPFISDFPNKTSIHRGFSGKPCLMTPEGTEDHCEDIVHRHHI